MTEQTANTIKAVLIAKAQELRITIEQASRNLNAVGLALRELEEKDKETLDSEQVKPKTSKTNQSADTDNGLAIDSRA